MCLPPSPPLAHTWTDDDGDIVECDYGYWAAGGDASPCTFCGEGYNTTANGTAPTTTAVTGAASASQCAIAAGWMLADAGDAAKGIAPCTRGSYKALIGTTSCVQCPNGTTTTITMAATAKSDCDTCLPGLGAASINLAAPACTPCTSGTYATGNIRGGANCTACPLPAMFTGKMVSRRVGSEGRAQACLKAAAAALRDVQV